MLKNGRHLSEAAAPHLREAYQFVYAAVYSTRQVFLFYFDSEYV